MSDQMNEFPLMSETEGLPLFLPWVVEDALKGVSETLKSRWIGQGPKVDLFEKEFQRRFAPNRSCVAVSSGTAALHLAYELAGLTAGDEVVCPLFTCTATNIPLLYKGCIPVFCDVAENSLNVNVSDVEKLITPKTKAIVVVDYGGAPTDYESLRELADRFGLLLIADCAHAIDGRFAGKFVNSHADFTIYSFQAIKTLTTGDGGMLVMSDDNYLLEKARRIRWFGIDRSAKQKGIWQNDIDEIGYKYQMTDISASIGLANLAAIDVNLQARQTNFECYKRLLACRESVIFECNPGHTNEVDFSPWLVTLNCGSHREIVMSELRRMGVESAQVHYRNDRYTIFAPFIRDRYFPNMDEIENSYLVVPVHAGVSEDHISSIADVALSFI